MLAVGDFNETSSPKRHTSYPPNLSLPLLLGSVVLSLSITITSCLASRPPGPWFSSALSCSPSSPSSFPTLLLHLSLPRGFPHCSESQHQPTRADLTSVRCVSLYLSRVVALHMCCFFICLYCNTLCLVFASAAGFMPYVLFLFIPRVSLSRL